MVGNFVYSALPPDHIRLITCTRSFTIRGSNITCKMISVPREAAPEFSALSYVWGSQLAVKTITCNGLKMDIAANLYQAMRTLCKPSLKLTGFLWIDAICINQKDDIEKAVQVRRMGDMYRQARRVLVWLGPAARNSDIAMESFVWLSEALALVPSPPEEDAFVELGLPHINDKVWPALGFLFRREWFGRLWTFQEAVLASDLTYICGNKLIGGQSLISTSASLRRLHLSSCCFRYETTKDHEDGIRAMEEIRLARNDYAWSESLPFTLLLAIARYKICSDPRDRIYGMLGITSESFRSRIPISYSTDASDGAINTYIICAKACIEENLPLILQLVARPNQIPDLPSWCPDMSSVQDVEYYTRNFCAGGQEADGHPFQAEVMVGSNSLAIAGFQNDTVSQVIEGTVALLEVPDSKWAQEFLQWNTRCLELARETIPQSSDTVPVDHIYVFAGAPTSGLPEQDENLCQAYFDIIVNLKHIANGGESALPPTERQSIFYKTWGDMFGACPGRRYFSTSSGRLGLGPPDTKPGDTVCVFYGTGPLFLLREADESPGMWTLVGDAYVHGLMDLEETLKHPKNEDEVFTII